MDVEYYGFEWDEEKNQRNIKVHRISFQTAVRVFNDPFLLEKYDSAYHYLRKALNTSNIYTCRCI